MRNRLDAGRPLLLDDLDLTNRLLFYLGTHFGHLAVLILGATWRLRVTGFDGAESYMRARKPLVMVTWHGRLIGSTYHCRKRNVVAMISQHRDGELVSQVVEKIGYETVRGSSTRGGSAAALSMIDKVRAGQTAAMIGDGPRGPIYKLKPGAAYIALMSGADVIPVIFAANRAWVFRSWDRFTVPKPFARVFLYYGEPIPHPGNDADLRDFTRQIENALEVLRSQAQREATTD